MAYVPVATQVTEPIDGEPSSSAGLEFRTLKTYIQSVLVPQFASYAPLTGVGTSGTWPISVTGNAATVTSVPWTSVVGRPTAVSTFANDAGYITTVGAAAAGSLTGNTLAANVLNSSLTLIGTLLNLSVTNPIAGSVTGSSASCTGNAVTASSTPYATNSGSANSVAWANVSGRPVNVSTWVNDSGYITAAGTSAACSGNAATASAVAWTGVTSKPLNSVTTTTATTTPVGGVAGDLVFGY